MTVATFVAGLLVNSLLHVLIVTPVIFTWLRERELRKNENVTKPVERELLSPQLPF
jgi:Cu(I)/Ag(I) efflux system membrane protein CusA/SilA